MNVSKRRHQETTCKALHRSHITSPRHDHVTHSTAHSLDSHRTQPQWQPQWASRPLFLQTRTRSPVVIGGCYIRRGTRPFTLAYSRVLYDPDQGAPAWQGRAYALGREDADVKLSRAVLPVSPRQAPNPQAPVRSDAGVCGDRRLSLLPSSRRTYSRSTPTRWWWW